MNLGLLIPVVAGAITVFGLILIAACTCCVDLRPNPRKRRPF